jgi:hypothetical protein
MLLLLLVWMAHSSRVLILYFELPFVLSLCVPMICYLAEIHRKKDSTDQRTLVTFSSASFFLLSSSRFFLSFGSPNNAFLDFSSASTSISVIGSVKYQGVHFQSKAMQLSKLQTIKHQHNLVANSMLTIHRFLLQVVGSVSYH